MIVTLHDRVFKKSNIVIEESCVCVNTLLTLYADNADNGKHQASIQGRAETTTWRKDLANRLYVSYIHAVV